MEDEVNR